MPGPTGGNPTPPATLTTKDIWDALRRAGWSATQAIGAMASGISESQLNPESVVTDANGAKSYGIWQFNTATYKDAGGLVTGNPAHDVLAQVTYLTSHGGMKAAAGSTPQEAAGNFAAQFERCAGCAAGGSQNIQRQANAKLVAGWIASGSWPVTGTAAADQAAAGQAAATADCAWQVGWGGVLGVGGFQACIVTRSQIRGAAGLLMMAGGAVFLLSAMGWVAALAGLKAADKVIQAAPMVGKVQRVARMAAPAPAPD